MIDVRPRAEPVTAERSRRPTRTAATGTAPGAAARTRSPRRTTSGPRWTRSAPTCCRRATCATRSASCCSAGWTAAVGWTGWPSGSRGCAPRPGGAATSAAPSTRSGPPWTRPWPPSGRPWPAPTATTPASPRWSWTPCPDDVAGAVRALDPYALAVRRGPGHVPGDPGHAAPRGAGRPVRRDEAGPGVPGPRGDAAGQGHAGRPERAARRACPQRGHHRRVSRLHGQAR